ncbi:hypothetical protein, partial [Methylobacterium sp. CG08_land_8_20_14_0_20_71_15]
MHGRELWTTDGTIAGTHLVADTDPGLYFGLPSNFVGLGNGLAAFQAITPASGVLAGGTWVTDGTTAGTRPLVVPLQDGGAVATLGNGQALAVNYDASHGNELWLLDANSGIWFLADLFPGTRTNAGSVSTTVNSSNPHSFITLGGDHVLFVAQNRYASDTLWSYDHGTVSLVRDNSYQSNGTLRLSEVDDLTAIGNGRALFASANAPGAVQLWVSDGTTPGTAPIFDFGPLARGQYGTDGSIGSIVALGDGRALVNVTLLGVSHLYITDGSTAGTYVVADGLRITSGAMGAEPGSGVVDLGGGRFMFAGRSDTAGGGLWVTDGTFFGTHLSDDPSNASLAPAELTLVNLLPTAPQPPLVALLHDTGANGTDRITSDPTLVVTPSRAGDTFLYALDGGLPSSTVPVLARDGSADGVHTVAVQERNLAGTLSSPTSFTFTLDTTADAGAPATLVVDGTGNGLLDRYEAGAVAFTVAGLDADAQAVASFSDGTHSTTAAVAADGRFTV